MINIKAWRRGFQKARNRAAGHFFDTRYGRELMISAMDPRVLTMTVNCGDHVMTFSPSDYIGRKIFRKGHFERHHVSRLLSVLKDMQLLPEGTTLLELGGNIGTQTVYFSLSRSFARIISVEPDPRNFELLKSNIAQNSIEDRVTLVNCAAGDHDGEIDFFQHSSNHGKSSTNRQSKSDTRIVVPVRRVDGILDEAAVPPNQVGLIWMDIEGHEPIACRSMEVLLSRRVPLYLEFSPNFYGPDQAAAFVRYLTGFYDDCLVFHHGKPLAMKVRALPIDQGQFDVLLFG
ncbi:FkbM family methyltransferase [Phyllobacterium myrsinacearum]|uniref:FkbM family methyltransferase n=1 Tax=Phyllobacterium myrsinacearum TaxID=28101 RepID=A0A839EGN4_9HYPH|nr:FkbM family methyltransferase [Phyllobacterium myrsinacearum]